MPTTLACARPSTCSFVIAAALLLSGAPAALRAAGGPTSAIVVPPATALAAPVAGPNALADVWPDYDAARAALANDRLGDLTQPAKRLQRTIDAVDAATLTADRAAVPAEKIGKVRELLPDLRKAAQALATASSLADARKAFGDVSKQLVAWRKMAASGPDVGFCPMVNKEWLQAAKTPVENPYGGPAMATCGEVAPPER